MVTIALEEGIEIERSTYAGVYVTEISNGDFIKVRSVDFKKGAGIFQANASSASGGFMRRKVQAEWLTLIFFISKTTFPNELDENRFSSRNFTLASVDFPTSESSFKLN